MRAAGLLPPPTVPSDGLDLAALHRADGAVRDAAAMGRSAAIADRLSEALSAVEPATADLVRRLIAELGRVEAHAAMAMQAAEESRRGRDQWVELDPLRARAGIKATARPLPPDHVSVSPADRDFSGFGWHPAEGQPGEGFRWARQSVTSVVLPSLGAGAIELRLDLVAPFGQPIRSSEITLLHEGAPLAFSLSNEGAGAAVLTARLLSDDEHGLGRLALVLSGPMYGDPNGQDWRQLGLGLRGVSAQRV